MNGDARDLTRRLVEEREERSESARRREEADARRAAETERSEEESFRDEFFRLRSLAPLLLERRQSQAELVTISHWKPQTALMEKLFPRRPEDAAAWEIARGFSGPYHPHHDIPVDTWDACRFMLTGDGRILFGASRSVAESRFEKPSEYTVIERLDPQLRSRLRDCGLGSASSVRNRIAMLESGSYRGASG